MGVGVSVQEHKAYSGESLATVGTGSKALESCAELLARGELLHKPSKPAKT